MQQLCDEPRGLICERERIEDEGAGFWGAWRLEFGRGMSEQTPSAYLWGPISGEKGSFAPTTRPPR